MAPLEALLMDLVLLRAYERALIDIGVDFDVGIVREFESIPLGSRRFQSRKILGEIYLQDAVKVLVDITGRSYGIKSRSA